MPVIPALLGWAGMAGTLAAYALVWRGRLYATSWQYAALNVVGGLLGGIASLLYGAWPAAASNFVWAAIGLQSLVRTVPPSARRHGDAPDETPTESVSALPAAAEVMRSKSPTSRAGTSAEATAGHQS